MKKASIFLVVLLVMSSCGSGDDSSNDLISIGGEDQSTEADQENTQQENTQQEKVNNEDSSNTEAKCEIFENSKQIDPNDFFGELHDAFMDIEENSIYNYNFEVRNGPFTLWKYEAAVELLKKVVPEIMGVHAINLSEIDK